MGWEKKNVEVYSKEDVNITVPNKIKKDLVFTIKHYKPILAPIEKDQKVADLIVKNKNAEIIKKFELFSKNEIKKMSFFSKVYYNFKFLLLGDSIFKTK